MFFAGISRRFTLILTGPMLIPVKSGMFWRKTWKTIGLNSYLRLPGCTNVCRSSGIRRHVVSLSVLLISLVTWSETLFWRGLVLFHMYFGCLCWVAFQESLSCQNIHAEIKRAQSGFHTCQKAELGICKSNFGKNIENSFLAAVIFTLSLSPP